ncbi:MAG: type II secretion system protein [Deltaproteobacteria bacterium]|nr:type II secretion system protein [Deltaproteobacteria bacterium]
MRARGFSLLELMVVVAVISIGGSLAVFAMSDQVQIAKARSDEIGLFMRIKTERNAARERLRALGISMEGNEVRFHRAVVTNAEGLPPACVVGEIVRRATFPEARLRKAGSPGAAAGNLCIDENGRPVGVFAAVITASDGRESTVTLTETGVLETSLNVASNDEVTGMGAPRAPDVAVDVAADG